MKHSPTDYTANLGRETAAMHDYVMASGRAVEHPKGHRKHLLRYLTPFNVEVAIEKRKGRPVMYFSSDVARGRIDHLSPDWMPASKTGRNSNLNAMETFANRPLARLEITTPEIGREAFDACMNP